MSDFKLHETQLEAIEHAASSKFAIITGGAGTGKTTIIKEIADRVHNSILCAFAGKAAARLKEATKMDTSTIHRALMFNGDTFARKSLSGYSVIVDEASMVSSDLMAEIMSRNPDRLILVGDQAQLPPVGKGQPFHDLISLKPDAVYHLTKCFRNTEAVFKAATAIRNGEMPETFDESESEKWEIVKTGSPEATQDQLLKYIQAGEIDFEQDIILCPRNGDNDEQACTVKGLNRAIVDIVNPRENELDKFLPGDRVINTKNYADIDIWNGTTGTIHAINDDTIFLRLDVHIVDEEKTDDPRNSIYKDIVQLNKERWKSLQLAYALTVHKSQGSQFRKVIFCAMERDSFRLLDRSLIYTAVTRTKEHCIVAGQVRAFRNGISKVIEKRTVLQEVAK